MSSSVVALLFFQLLIAMSTFNISSCYGRSYVGCVESESKALLRFKGDLKDPSNRLSSWIADTDCCKWAGIVCNNFTGNVIRLHLRNPFNYEIVYEAFERSSLVGEINTHLLELKHLLYLDLSGNNFSPNNQIPRFLGSLTNLEYLNLSFCGFGGLIPPQLGNLSNLQYLDLNQESNVNGLYVENLNWLSGLSLLEHLDLTSVNLAKASSWLLDINTLPHLLVLKLSNCDLSHFPLPPIANFSSLAILDLSHNNFDEYFIPAWIFGLGDLIFLDLSFNYFNSPIPEGLQNLTSLRHLDLSWNYFNSSVPNWFYRFSHLEYLSLSCNSLSGITLVMMKGQAVEYNANLNLVRSIDLSRNNFSGEIPLEVMNLGALQSFNLSHNSLTGTIPKSIGAMKSLESIDFSANQLSGKIPQSFSNLTFLSYLNLSNNKLVGEIPLSTQLQGFDPSYFVGNELCGSPLPKKCAVEVPKSENGNGVRGEDGDDHEVNWGFYVSMAVGFVMGFWGVVGPLFVSRRWRGTYYSFLNKFWDKFYIVVLRRYCY
ncbi:Leucine-rich repeat receptor protein kinase [Melia azedarach]|uniref:Leucine-rich repeat receptor protein kinase n=1 Tax=Melia azedarach TaxID=155640 RepID=A0ACC1WPL1_MELAZ|nr:Leucine-rich repeat receptor protein kinase [Melia azedarach]